MDLTRLGFRGLRQISDKTRSFYEFLNDLLDGKAPAVFEPRTDVETLESHRYEGVIGSSARRNEIFNSFMPFFEAGFHIRRSVTTTGQATAPFLIEGLFIFGRVFQPGPASDCPFSPPLVLPRQILRGRGSAVLEAFELEQLTSLAESMAFLFGIDGQSVFLFLCQRPGPWQEAHILQTRKVLDAIEGLT